MRFLVICASLLVAGLLTACGSKRTVAGAIRLEQWEDGRTYYMHKGNQDDEDKGGSYIGGIVLHLGWNSRWIIAERHSIFRGDPDGWMIINVATSAVTGPFTDAEIKTRPEAQGIKIYGVEEAWNKL